MELYTVLSKIDKIICFYLGLEQEEIRPISAQVIGGQLMVANTTSFKRHIMNDRWNNFSLFGIKQTNQENREKLGLAVGKAIAKKLAVSFEETQMKRF